MQLKFMQKDNKMFLLSRNDIEEIAYKLLCEYSPQNINNPTSIDTKEFIEDYLGLTIKYKHIHSCKGTGVIGLIVMDDIALIPSLDDSFNPILIEETYGTMLITPQLLGDKNMPRRRYTQMHEAAHYILHREHFNWCLSKNNSKVADRQYIACRKIELTSQKPRTEHEWLEWQADALAASILMPKDAFNDFAKSVLQKHGISRGYIINDQYVDKKVVYEILQEIAQKFEVSRKAAKIRMYHLGLMKKSSLIDARNSTV